MSTYNIEMNLLNSSSTYDVLYPKVNLSNTQGSLPASQISSGTFSSGDYTIPGNLTLKGSGNYGTKLNLGDGDYVHISEPTDDCLEIKGKKINFVTSDTSSSGLTWNNSAIGGNSDSIKFESHYYTGTGEASTSGQGVNLVTLQNISSPIYIQLGIHTSFLFVYPFRYYVKDTIASPRVSDFTYNLCFDMQAVSNGYNYIVSKIDAYDGQSEKSIAIYFTKSTSIISLRNINADVMNAQGKQYYCFVLGY